MENVTDSHEWLPNTNLSTSIRQHIMYSRRLQKGSYEYIQFHLKNRKAQKLPIGSAFIGGQLWIFLFYGAEKLWINYMNEALKDAGNGSKYLCPKYTQNHSKQWKCFSIRGEINNSTIN